MERTTAAALSTTSLLDSPLPFDSFAEFAESVREELSPRSALESVLVDCIARSAWRLHETSGPSTTDECDAQLLTALDALGRLRSLSGPRPEPRSDALERPADVPGTPWRGRLMLDAGVSEDSPVVIGTWITVRHIVSLVVDGWSWADILRAHPELCEDDIRACLSFAVEEEGACLGPGVL